MSRTPNIRRSQEAYSESKHDKHDSSYFVPALALEEPAFVIPPIPQLTKVPPPVVRKPPVQGFDMRTLRKQVEMLNGEIYEKEETQSLLYNQNEQLWAYIQQLLQANKTNAQVMREEVFKLHKELRAAHQERFNIAEKLQLARNSKQLLVELNQELEGAQLSIEEVARRKMEAEEALLHAKEENTQLEEVLRAQTERMKGVHVELDQFRQRRLDEQALDLADDFFYTNKTILRAAYYRFRSGVQKRFKLNRIHTTVSAVYHRHTKAFFFRSWCGFIHRKHIMYRNQAHRREESLVQCMQRWKVFTVLEKFFQRSRRKQVLKRCFSAWKADAQEVAYEKWAVIATKELHLMQFKRKIFRAWRQGTVFLSWNSPVLRLLEGEATVHFLKTLFSAWVAVARVSRRELIDKQRRVPGIILWYHLTRWRELCNRRWKGRGNMMRRLFRNLRCKISERAERAVTSRYVYGAYVAHRQQRALRKWQSFLRLRRLFITVPSTVYFQVDRPRVSLGDTWESSGSGLFVDTTGLSSPTALADHFGSTAPTPGTAFTTTASTQLHTHPYSQQPLLGALVGSLGHALDSGLIGGRKIARHRRPRQHPNRFQVNRTFQVLSHMKRRWLRTSLLQWVFAASVLRRQRLCLQAGMKSYLNNTALRGLQHWHSVVRRVVGERRERRRYVLQAIVTGWKEYSRESKAARVLEEGQRALQYNVQQRRQCDAFRLWQVRIRQQKQLQRSMEYIAYMQKRRTLRVTFTSWRCCFTKLLFWKVKELSVEHSRVAALNDLNRQTLEDLEQEQNRTIEQSSVLEQSVVALQEALADANNANKQRLKEMAEKEVEKSELLVALQALQQELRDVQAEQEHMRAFEDILMRELNAKEVQDSEVRQKALARAERATAETHGLKEEVATARAHAVYMERTAEAEVRRGQEEVAEVQQRAEQAQRDLLQRREVLLALESERSGWSGDTEKVQRRLDQVAKDGAALIAENEALIRSKGSAVRVLKSTVGLKQARIKELNNVITELEGVRSQAHLQSQLQRDDSELQELMAMQRQIESNAHRTGSTSVGSSKGVSLYHNTLSSPGPAALPGPPALSGTHSSGRRAMPAGRSPLSTATSHSHTNTGRAPTPPVRAPHSLPRRERHDGAGSAIGGSIFELIPPNKGRLSKEDLEPALQSTAPGPMPREPPVVSSSITTAWNAERAAPRWGTIPVSAGRTNTGPSTWSTSPGSNGFGGHFTPPASPSKAFPRSPTFLTAALDTDSESDPGAHSSAVSPHFDRRAHVLSHVVVDVKLPTEVRETEDLSLGSRSGNAGSPDSQAVSEQQLDQNLHGHEQQQYCEEEDEGSSFGEVLYRYGSETESSY